MVESYPPSHDLWRSKAGRFLSIVVLIGQPEVRHRITSIPQLNQRIAAHTHFGLFTAEETASYIAHDGSCDLPDRRVYKDAVAAIHGLTKGVDRLINALCDQCLFAGAIENVSQIDDWLVQRVWQCL